MRIYHTVSITTVPSRPREAPAGESGELGRQLGLGAATAAVAAGGEEGVGAATGSVGLRKVRLRVTLADPSSLRATAMMRPPVVMG